MQNQLQIVNFNAVIKENKKEVEGWMGNYDISGLMYEY
jgi:hypothetical protein